MTKELILWGLVLVVSALYTWWCVAAQSVTLAWDRNPEPDIDHYNLYWGPAPGSYPLTTNVGQGTALGITRSTVGTQLERMYEKTGVHSVQELVLWLVKHRYIDEQGELKFA